MDARDRPTMTRIGLALLLSLTVLLAPGAAEPRWQDWRTVGPAEGMPVGKIFAVLVDGKRVWAGTQDGLVLVERGSVQQRIGRSQGLPHPVVTALAQSPLTGDLWVGTMAGLARVSAGRVDAFSQLTSGLANDVVYGVAVDGPTVWVATAAGLSAYDTRRDEWQLYDVTNTLMHEPWCYAVTTNERSVLVAVWGGGVIERDHRTGRFREHRDPDGEMEIDLFRDDGLVHDVTSSVAYSDDILWVGTYFGLSRYENRRWQTYNEADSGLAGDFINHLRADGRAVWIATDRGLSRFDGETWDTWRVSADGGHQLIRTGPDGTRRTRDMRTGPASDIIFGVDVDRDGEIWLATAKGLSHTVAPAPGPVHAAARRATDEGGER